MLSSITAYLLVSGVLAVGGPVPCLVRVASDGTVTLEFVDSDSQHAIPQSIPILWEIADGSRASHLILTPDPMGNYPAAAPAHVGLPGPWPLACPDGSGVPHALPASGAARASRGARFELRAGFSRPVARSL